MSRINHFLKTVSRLTPSSAASFYKLKYLTKKSSDIHYLKLKNGLTLSVNKNAGDLTTLFEIFINDDYDFRKLSGELNILDIGANVGFFSLYVANKFPLAKVYSFEPFPKSYQRMQENLKRNHVSNVKTFPFAVSDKEGKVEFFSTEWAGCNTIFESNFEGWKYDKTQVDCVSFDKIFELTGARHFDFAKIDCEGSEYPIILNSSDESLKAINKFIIEVHEVKNFNQDQLVKRFEGLGFKSRFVENLPLLIVDKI